MSGEGKIMAREPALDGWRAVAYGRHAVWPGSPGGSTGGSDMVLHLPVLEHYASLCSHVTELGTRHCQSTVALLCGCKGEVHSYDVVKTPDAERLERAVPRWKFHQGCSLSAVLAPTELLLFDTLHTYGHLSRELERHEGSCSRFLVFHDTESCWAKDVSGPDPDAEGIGRAITPLLSRYRTVYRTSACNGLIVLEK